MDIRHVIARRNDLSTFLVHLTRDTAGASARDNLRSILRAWRLNAVSMFGHATRALMENGLDLDSQKCICFTETPLEYVHLLLEPIEGRAIQFAPYGVAFPKKIGREKGVNPVWYVDITPSGTGRDWLTRPLDRLVAEAIASGNFDAAPIARLTPFIEQMGTGPGYRKEFWWEREWRAVRLLTLPDRVIVLCPEPEFDEFRRLVDENADRLIGGGTATFVDPRWGLEQIIARLAGYSAEDNDIF